MSAKGPRYIAQKKGEKYYMIDSPCKRGHLSLRVTGSGTCVECRRFQEKERYYANPEKTKQLVRKKYLSNAEKLKEARRNYYANNADKEREIAKVRSASWRKLNPNHVGTKLAKKVYSQSPRGRLMAYVNTAKRRSAKMFRTPSWLTDIDYERIQNEYKLAALLSKITGNAWHVDHIVPLQGKMVSGLHVPTNLRAIPGVENIAKANRYKE